MYAASADNTYYQDSVNQDTTWHEIVLENIPIRNGKVEIGFTAAAKGSSWCHIDDVTLKREHDE